MSAAYDYKETKNRKWVKVGKLAFVFGVLENTLDDRLPFDADWVQLGENVFVGFVKD